MYQISDLPGWAICRYEASESEKAIQVADAIAWAIFQRYERGNETFYRLIQEKIILEEMVR